MRILIPIGLLFVFVLFVIVVVIQSLFEVPEELTSNNNNSSSRNDPVAADAIKVCLETAKTMPLPVLNCVHGECKSLYGVFQCQKLSVDKNKLIQGTTEQIFCRNITKVLSCDTSSDEAVMKSGNNTPVGKHHEFKVNKMCFTTRGIYNCGHNNCQRVSQPITSCQCEINPSINEISLQF